MHKYGVKCLLEDFLEEYLRRCLWKVAEIWAACLFKGGKVVQVVLDTSLPCSCPDCFMWLILTSHTATSFFKTILHLLILIVILGHYQRTLFFTWADSKWYTICTKSILGGQYKLLKCGLWVWEKLCECTFSPLLLTHPACTLPAFKMGRCWK